MDEYPYSLIVECLKELTRKQRKELENYFSLRRKSQGGPCIVSSETSTQYRVSYQKEEVWIRVLNKEHHEIESDGEVITLVIYTEKPQKEVETAPCSSDDEKESERDMNMKDSYEEPTTLVNYTEEPEMEAEALPFSSEEEAGAAGPPAASGEEESRRSSTEPPRRPAITSSYIPVNNSSAVLVIKDEISNITKDFQDLHINVGQCEIELSGNPTSLIQARKRLKDALSSVKKDSVKISECKQKFLMSLDKEEISQIIFGKKNEGQLILDTSCGLCLYAPSIVLLEQAKKALDITIVEEVVEVKTDEYEKSWRNTVENIKHNKNIYVSCTEGKKNSKVTLAGIRKDVEMEVKKLKECLSKHNIVKEEVNLKNPIFVKKLDDLLKTFKLGPIRAKVQIPQSSGHVVILTGCRDDVSNSKDIVVKLLMYFHQHLLFNKSGAIQFFRMDEKQITSQILQQYNCWVGLNCDSDITNLAIPDEAITIVEHSAIERCSTLSTPEKSNESNQKASGGTTTNNAQLPVQLILSYGNLEDQKVDVLTAPLLASNPHYSVNVTKALKSKAGNPFSVLLTTLLTGRSASDTDHLVVMDVSGDNYKLDCNTVIFIPCTTWNGNVSEMALRKGLSECLEKCKDKNACSLAMPTIGTGLALRFPIDVAARLLGEEVKSFVMREPTTSLRKIHIVIQPDNKILYAAYRDTLMTMDLGDQIVLCDGNGEAFPRLSIGDQIQVKAGDLTVHVVYSDIVTEATDAIVNATNFHTWTDKSVAHAIFSRVGPDITRNAKLQSASGNLPVITESRNLNCKWILHCNCGNNLESIQPLVETILQKCEDFGIKSVALPAIGTGECRFDPQSVGRSITNAINSFIQNKSLSCLSVVRLIAYQPHIYSIFCNLVREQFSSVPEPSWSPWAVISNRLKHREIPGTPFLNDITYFEHPIPKPPPALFSIIGQREEEVEAARRHLKQAFDDQYGEEEINDQMLKNLSLDEMQKLFSPVKDNVDVQMILDTDKISICLKGCQATVMQVSMNIRSIMKTIVHSRREQSKQEKAGLLIQWAYNEGSTKVPFLEDATFILESAFLFHNNGIVTVDIEDGKRAKVNLGTMKASLERLNQEVTVLRSDLESDIKYPMNWEAMGERFLTTVRLDASSKEYQTVEAGVLKTTDVHIFKIERIQNRYQYTAYMLRKAFMQETYGSAGVNERTLYHEVASENCDSINFRGFNSSVGDENDLVNGRKVYFAVNAEYATRQILSTSDENVRPRVLYQVKVLAGHYTESANAPGSPSAINPVGQYDSLVDNKVTPTTYSVCHDSQVYPEYIIHFINS
ncbi:protein mono-ADP-ribosyltransferase PARP14 [Bombina bombina]|uniref:protein mono-ADP-ribosyltransferase PARP14 n=1 Tax=Bombina bombina TaxID=8345 RepID=UPI00235A57C0|nr:protein mono-ADP-ribosyltransferase PARP14 [Bombina bombina]